MRLQYLYLCTASTAVADGTRRSENKETWSKKRAQHVPKNIRVSWNQ